MIKRILLLTLVVSAFVYAVDIIVKSEQDKPEIQKGYVNKNIETSENPVNGDNSPSNESEEELSRTNDSAKDVESKKTDKNTLKIESNKPLDKAIGEISSKEYKYVTTTVFWVGEEGSVYNGFIDNKSSAWISDWVGSFGGFDDPYDRCGFKPCGFEPKENPFYFALPYEDTDEYGPKESLKRIPWYDANVEPHALIKDRWIEVVYNGKKCYAQWEDVGPYEIDDFEYVFGSSPPKNKEDDVRSGLDVSPAMRDCLNLDEDGISMAGWRFVEFEEVPEGPWLETITTTQ